jgi:ABC-2 type transport system ATP-binding protein
MTSSSPLAIQTQGLTKVYGRKAVVSAIDLAVPKHSIFGFLGQNGAGKSTTMKMLIGAIRPSQGEGLVCGHDIQRDSLAVRQRIGYLAQDIRFYPDLTPRETLQFCANFYPPQSGKLTQRINEVLELVGLRDKADRQIQGFSGGERQRLGIAQACIHKPNLVILDEPVSALDPMGRYDVLQIMQNLRQYTTIFFSTHILSDVQKICDRVAIIDQGILVTQGTIESVLSADKGIVYNVTTKGDTDAVQRTLMQQPWITSLNTRMSAGQLHWEIGVTDEHWAETRLLRLLLQEPQVQVSQFGRKTYQLEDIFVNLVAGESR